MHLPPREPYIRNPVGCRLPDDDRPSVGLTADSLTVSGLCGRDAAYYGLLMAEARYKCYLPVSEDTSVFSSSEYYRRHGPDSLYARALMMSGAVHAENGDPSSALEKYKAAEPVMEAAGDYEQLGLLQTRIGELYQLTYSDVSRAVYYYRLYHCRVCCWWILP